MILSKRLQTIYKMCPKGVIADIGADHGKLIISLVQNDIASFGIAVENKKGPFERLVGAIKEAGLEDKIQAIYGDGIEKIPSVVDTLIIAGMGGQNIVSILKRNQNKLENVQTIIVDPHNAIPFVREQISLMGYSISDEEMVYEDEIYYEIIKFNKSKHAFYSDVDLEFGPVLRSQKSLTFKQKYQSRLNEITRLIKEYKLPQQRIDDLLAEETKIRSILWTPEHYF